MAIMGEPVSLTRLIHRAQRGDAAAAASLVATTYPELRKLARARLRPGGRSTLRLLTVIDDDHGPVLDVPTSAPLRPSISNDTSVISAGRCC